MSTDSDTTRLVRRWLEEGATQLPDRVLDGVLDELPAIRQRRSASRERWFRGAHFAMAATVAVAVVMAFTAIAGVFAPSGTPVGGPGLIASATPSPTPNATFPDDGVELAPGRHALPTSLGVPVTVEVGEGWHNCSLGPREIAICTPPWDSGAALGFAVIEYVVDDPCDPAAGGAQLGGDVEDLVDAIASLDGFTASAPEPVFVDGVEGVAITVTAPGPCPASLEGLFTWATRERVNGVSPHETNEVIVLEVGGERLLIAVAYHPTTSRSAIDAAREILQSVRFER